eukprot:6272023-Amphidinium_carterae.1
MGEPPMRLPTASILDASPLLSVKVCQELVKLEVSWVAPPHLVKIIDIDPDACGRPFQSGVVHSGKTNCLVGVLGSMFQWMIQYEGISHFVAHFGTTVGNE